MELLNGLYKLDSDRLNVIVRRNTGNIDENGNIIYQNLGHFTKMANALKFLHEYHIKTKLNGLNDIERIIDVLSQSSAEVLKAIENIKDSELDIIYVNNSPPIKVEACNSITRSANDTKYLLPQT